VCKGGTLTVDKYGTLRVWWYTKDFTNSIGVSKNYFLLKLNRLYRSIKQRFSELKVLSKEFTELHYYANTSIKHRMRHDNDKKICLLTSGASEVCLAKVRELDILIGEYRLIKHHNAMYFRDYRKMLDVGIHDLLEM
jgi:hypothetical protein